MISKNLAISLAALQLFAWLWSKCQEQQIEAGQRIYPKSATGPVIGDADDPAIWVNPQDPSQSLIIGTDKGSGKGGLFVWDLDGTQLQFLHLPERPNNVDVRAGMRLGGRSVDIAVTNLRHTRQLKVYSIDPHTRKLADITTPAGINTPELDVPYGLCLYRRPRDGAVFVIESAKIGPSSQSLHEYLLHDDGRGYVAATYIRAFGRGSIRDKVEGLVADDATGYLYAADEKVAVRMYEADPDRHDGRELASFAGPEDGFESDREGLALYTTGPTTGYLLVSNQRGKHTATVKVYRREGDPGDPRRHALVATLNTWDSYYTDGIDATSQPVPGRFPHGFLVKHDEKGNQFKIYDWDELQRAIDAAQRRGLLQSKNSQKKESGQTVDD